MQEIAAREAHGAGKGLARAPVARDLADRLSVPRLPKTHEDWTKLASDLDICLEGSEMRPKTPRAHTVGGVLHLLSGGLPVTHAARGAGIAPKT